MAVPVNQRLKKSSYLLFPKKKEGVEQKVRG
jgi:hypothetical protein